MHSARYREQQYKVKTRGPRKCYFACVRSTARQAAGHVAYRLSLCDRMCNGLALQQSGACAQCMRPKGDPQQGSRWAGKRAIGICPYRHGGSRVYSVCGHTASETHKPSTSARRNTSVLHPCAAALRFFSWAPVVQTVRVGTAPCLWPEPLKFSSMVYHIR